MINIIGILSVIIAILIFSLIRSIIKNKGLMGQMQFLANKPPIQTIFDPAGPTNTGMDIINSFINANFLKFINSKLIQFNEKSEVALTQLFSSLSSDEDMKTFIEGFVTLITVNMSQELKTFFNKYYNVLDEQNNTNDVFINYVSEWCVLKIRSMQAQMSLSHQNPAGGLDYSLQKDLEINSSMFLEIELNLYHSLGIINDQNIGNIGTGGKK